MMKEKMVEKPSNLDIRKRFVLRAREIIDRELGERLSQKVTVLPRFPWRIEEETLDTLSKLANGKQGLFFKLARSRFVPLKGEDYAYEIQLDPEIFQSDLFKKLEGKVSLGNEEDYLKHEILHIKFYEMLPDEIRKKMTEWHNLTKNLFYVSPEKDFLETNEGKFFLKEAGALTDKGRVDRQRLSEIKDLMKFVTDLTSVSEAYTHYISNPEDVERFLRNNEIALKVARAFMKLDKGGVDINDIIQKNPTSEAIINEAEKIR